MAREDRSTEISFRIRLTKYGESLMEDRLAGSADTVELPTLADEMADYFMSDPETMQHVRGLVRSLAYETLTAIVGRTRKNADPLILSGTKAVRRSKILGAVPAAKWEKFLEQANGRQIRFTAMTRDDLLAAAEAREKGAATSMVLATFERKLAKELKPGERVGDRFNADRLDTLFLEVSEQPIRIAPLRERLVLGSGA